MKLLIVDDEELTRVGLIASVDWRSLGIEQIFQADDGINALNIAYAQKPDIILSDVRMPRMDGIQLAERLEEVLPDTSIIFMSGYSDKEYLKAAIKLKAVNYVEKPLNPGEIKEAVMEAAKRYEKNLRTRQNENLYSIEKASRLALLLARPYNENSTQILELADELSLRLMPGSSFTTYIVKLRTPEPDVSLLHDIRSDFADYLAHYHLQVFYVQIHSVYHVFHIMGSCTPSPIALSAVEGYLKEQFAMLGDFFIGRGDTVTGISRAYHSYTNAVILLQSSFFFCCGTLLSMDSMSRIQENVSPEQSDEFIADFREALRSKDQDACFRLLDQLYAHYFENRIFLPNQVKDLYYKLFICLNDSRQFHQIGPDAADHTTEESTISYLEDCFTYTELHQMLAAKTNAFFDALNAHVPEDSTIFIIKDYISKNYANDALSIKEISDHVFLSVSYVCTYFKNQTGQTLNQYLTEYRMEKAMQLLADARYQITDISSKVGYSNGNYFSKIFKKFTGLSPSKYREKMLG